MPLIVILILVSVCLFNFDRKITEWKNWLCWNWFSCHWNEKLSLSKTIVVERKTDEEKSSRKDWFVSLIAWLKSSSYFTCIISFLCNGKFTVVEKSDKAYFSRIFLRVKHNLIKNWVQWKLLRQYKNDPQIRNLEIQCLLEI